MTQWWNTKYNIQELEKRVETLKKKVNELEEPSPYRCGICNQKLDRDSKVTENIINKGWHNKTMWIHTDHLTNGKAEVAHETPVE